MEERLDLVRFYLEGMGRMLTQPEFLGGRSAQRAVEILEDAQLIKYIKLTEVSSGKIDITIGEEHSHPDLKSFSVILSEYGIPGMVSGLICAIGPTRMDYSTTVATIRYVAKFLSNLYVMRNGNRT
jgi:heat-inducible transcriptional repressor